MPIGPLMIEHRLIERMIVRMKKETDRIEMEHNINPGFIDIAVDFIRVYADRCHHGKEEEILFRELKKKDIEEDHSRTMEELIEDHKWGRETTKKLVEAKENYINGDENALETVLELINQLVDFYPKHIKKEDKTFFIPIMQYFSNEEQDAMLHEEYEFDKNFIHFHYKEIVIKLENECG